MLHVLLLFILSISLVIFINFICSKYNFLIYKPNLNHKEAFESKILNTGGLILFLYFFIINSLGFFINDFYYSIFFLLSFFVGILSDINNLDAKKRLIFIFIITIFILILTDNYIVDLKFNIINDLFAKYSIISILFTVICVVILINGINFIDGVHGLATFYSIIVISLLNYFTYFVLSSEKFTDNSIFLLPVLAVIFLYNIREKLFFGDSGSYLIASILAIYIISLTNSDEYSHPYLYANLLIYPAFEVFFSIFRKLLLKKNPYKPDQKHLHHLLQNFYLKRNFNLKKSKIISGILINISVIFFNIIAINFYKDKYFLIANIFIFSIFYCIVYFVLNSSNQKTKKN